MECICTFILFEEVHVVHLLPPPFYLWYWNDHGYWRKWKSCQRWMVLDAQSLHVHELNLFLFLWVYLDQTIEANLLWRYLELFRGFWYYLLLDFILLRRIEHSSDIMVSYYNCLNFIIIISKSPLPNQSVQITIIPCVNAHLSNDRSICIYIPINYLHDIYFTSL